jgi:hypothetical protein
MIREPPTTNHYFACNGIRLSRMVVFVTVTWMPAIAIAQTIEPAQTALDPNPGRSAAAGVLRVVRTRSSRSTSTRRRGSAKPEGRMRARTWSSAPGVNESGFDITFPVKMGLSLDDYYELAGVDHTFGFLSLGAIATLPLFKSSQNGAWDVHGGIEFQSLGDTPEAFNGGDQSKFIGIIGIGPP